MTDTKQILRQLCEADGISGEENSAAQTALKMLKEFDENAYIDSFHSVIGYIGEKDGKKPTLLLDAHIDEIGLIVTFIDDDGFIKVGQCGGIDRRLLLAQTVTVQGKEKIKGVISTLPPHVSADAKTAAKTEDIAIDTGFSKEELLARVSLGDKIVFDSGFSELPNDRVSCKAIDDRSGVAAILYALGLVKGKECAFNLAVQFSSQEELGGTGATIAAYNSAPDFAIAVDVSFAATPDAKPHLCGKMGQGVMIGYAPSLDKEMSARMTELAKKAEISYQTEVMSGKTGTNADEITVTRNGVRSVTLSIPEKYMHTPVETVQISDIENTGRLIAEFILGGMTE